MEALLKHQEMLLELLALLNSINKELKKTNRQTDKKVNLDFEDILCDDNDMKELR